MISLLSNAIDTLLLLLEWAIVARALLSWFAPRADHPAVRILNQITEPILAPLRRFIPLVGMMDITPIVALLLLQVVRQVVLSLLIGF
jgi:YggT family protein